MGWSRRLTDSWDSNRLPDEIRVTVGAGGAGSVRGTSAVQWRQGCWGRSCGGGWLGSVAQLDAAMMYFQQDIREMKLSFAQDVSLESIKDDHCLALMISQYPYLKCQCFKCQWKSISA